MFHLIMKSGYFKMEEVSVLDTCLILILLGYSRIHILGCVVFWFSKKFLIRLSVLYHTLCPYHVLGDHIEFLYCLFFNYCLTNLFLQQRYRRDRFPSHDRDLSVERPDLDDDKTMMNMHKEQRKREIRDRRIRDHAERDPDLDNSRDLNSQRFPDKKKSVKKSEGYGLASDFASHDDKDALKSTLLCSFLD